MVTVPAYFDDIQRVATKQACELAGLECLHLLNEPTAAALAYGADRPGQADKNILVFDLGGGTFDVTVMEIRQGRFIVKATTGDTNFGGQDIDNVLLEYFLD